MIYTDDLRPWNFELAPNSYGISLFANNFNDACAQFYKPSVAFSPFALYGAETSASSEMLFPAVGCSFTIVPDVTQ